MIGSTEHESMRMGTFDTLECAGKGAQALRELLSRFRAVEGSQGCGCTGRIEHLRMATEALKLCLSFEPGKTSRLLGLAGGFKIVQIILRPLQFSTSSAHRSVRVFKVSGERIEGVKNVLAD